MSNTANTRTRKSAAERKAEAEAKAAAEAQVQDEQPQPEPEPEPEQQPQAESTPDVPSEEELAAIRAAHERFEQFTAVMRVRVTFADRKMSVPGRIHMTQDQRPILVTNWGLELDLSKEPVTAIEVKNLDSGRFEALAA